MSDNAPIGLAILFTAPWTGKVLPRQLTSTDILHAADNQPVEGDFSGANIILAFARADEPFVILGDEVVDGYRRILVGPR